MTERYAATIAVIIVIALNGVWYAAKAFLHARGVPVRWFSGHFQDLASLGQLAEHSSDQAERRRARTLLWVLRGGIAVFLLLVLPLFCFGATRGKY